MLRHALSCWVEFAVVCVVWLTVLEESIYGRPPRVQCVYGYSIFSFFCAVLGGIQLFRHLRVRRSASSICYDGTAGRRLCLCVCFCQLNEACKERVAPRVFS